MKLILIPKNIDEITKANDLVDGFIIGVESLSTNMPFYVNLNELKEILKMTSKKVFVSLNKNMHSKDLNFLKEILLELEKLNIEGILYYDVSVVNIKQELSLKKELVWSAEHLVTNSLSINFWKDEGVNFAYLSSDITIEEIKKIKNETDVTLMMNIFGYVPIFTSYRHLIKNYLKTFNLNDNSEINYIEKEGKKYPIVDKENTTVYSSNILNACLQIDEEVIIEIIKLFKELNEANKDEINSKINSYFKNIDNGFLNKETIYRVIK